MKETKMKSQLTETSSYMHSFWTMVYSDHPVLRKKIKRTLSIFYEDNKKKYLFLEWIEVRMRHGLEQWIFLVNVQ